MNWFYGLLGIIVVLELLSVILEGVADGIPLPVIAAIVCVTLGGVIYTLFWIGRADASGENPPPPAADENAPLLPPGDPAQDEVEELGRRQETPGEIAARTRSGPGFIALGLFLLGGFLLFVSAQRNVSALLLLIAVPVLANASWLAWRREQQSPAAQEVLRVSGPLRWVESEDEDGGAWFFIGERQLEVPAHWWSWAHACKNRRLSVELRTSDNSLVSVGNLLSIDTDEQRIPSVPLGEHGLFALVSAFLLFMTLLVGGNLDSAGLYAQALFQPAEPAMFDSAQDFLAHPPALGRKVELRGKVRCGIQPSEAPHPPRIDCTNARWDGEPLQVADLTPTDPALRLASGALLKARRDEALDEATFQARQTSGSHMLVEEVSPLVLAIDEHCGQTGDDAQAACRRLQITLVDSLMIVDDTAKPADWPALLALARSGRLAAGRGGDRAMITRANLRRLRAALYELAPAAMQAHYGQALQATLASERGGILVRGAIVLFGRSGGRCDAGFARDAQAPYWLRLRLPVTEIGEPQLDWVGFWQELRALDRYACQPELRHEGLLVRFETDAQGTPVIELDDWATQDLMWRALILLLTVLVFFVFTVLHTRAFFLLRRSKKQREARLRAAIARKPA